MDNLQKALAKYIKILKNIPNERMDEFVTTTKRSKDFSEYKNVENF